MTFDIFTLPFKILQVCFQMTIFKQFYRKILLLTCFEALLYLSTVFTLHSCHTILMYLDLKLKISRSFIFAFYMYTVFVLLLMSPALGISLNGL